MAWSSDAVMVLLCGVASDPAGHDDWHTYEHMHERLSIPGFLRGSRWVRDEGEPRYMILYEIDSPQMVRSPAYLARLNDPTPWTAATMQRLVGMRRGFCRVATHAGYGLGSAAFALRFSTNAGTDEAARKWLGEVISRLAPLRGFASAALLEPVAGSPMTKEQSIRGSDADLTPLLVATGYDAPALWQACERELDADALARHGIARLDAGRYTLGFTATAAEVARTPANPVKPGSPGYR